MGGAEVALLDMLASLRQAQPEWKLHLIVSADGVVAEKARRLGVSTTILPFPDSLARLGDSSAGGPAGNQKGRVRLLSQLLLASSEVAQYVRKLRQKLGEIDPHLVHTNGFKMHLLGAIAKRRVVPLIWHFHDYLTPRPVMARLIKFFQRRCATALANSNSVRLDVISVCGEQLPIKTFYNGIDTSVFSPLGDQLDLDALSGLSPAAPGTIRIGMLATLARWKGHETFLRALSRLQTAVPVRAYIIGDALYQTEGSQYSIAELKSLAESLGVSGMVGFTGFVNDPAKAMRSLDILVHASTQPEPFGLVIVEGMACGRAVVFSDAGGASELTEPGISALGHAPGDADELSRRLEDLAADPNLRARLGSAGRRIAGERFDRTRLAGELIPIYQAVTAGSAVSH